MNTITLKQKRDDYAWLKKYLEELEEGANTEDLMKSSYGAMWKYFDKEQKQEYLVKEIISIDRRIKETSSYPFKLLEKSPSYQRYDYILSLHATSKRGVKAWASNVISKEGEVLAELSQVVDGKSYTKTYLEGLIETLQNTPEEGELCIFSSGCESSPLARYFKDYLELEIASDDPKKALWEELDSLLQNRGQIGLHLLQGDNFTSLLYKAKKAALETIETHLTLNQTKEIA